MSSQDRALPTVGRSRTLDDTSVWFWQFLKSELSPYPGRAWVVGRMTIAATLVMVIVMTFRIPYGFLGAIYTFFLSRENPRLTFIGAVKTTAVYVVATVYTIVGVVTLVGSPITHFLWIVLSLFLAFYFIRVVTDYFTAVGFGFTLAGAIPLWDQTYLSVHQRTENTLWLGFAVVVGSSVTVAVEYIFRRVHPATDLTEGIETRLAAVEELLRQIASGKSSLKVQKDIALYVSVGTSRIRRLLNRSGYPPQFVSQMNTAVALLGRLVDLAASLQIVSSNRFFAASPADRERCLRLADHLAGLRQALQQRKLPPAIELPGTSQPSELPFLPEIESTVALIPQAFSGTENMDDLFVAPPIDEVRQHLFVADAFSNPDHLKFAIRGTLATMLAYVVYQSVDWTGLSTSVATCIITALSTIGSSRQKQFLRLGGAIIGGFVFGMGAQVFILPYLDGITGFTILFAGVTAISAWIATASPRLSYLGVQLALAFYLINLQEFAIQSSLAIARDRVMGVLLGLLCMWLVFDHLWVRDALQEMQEGFARNLRLLSELAEQARNPDRMDAVRRVIRLREQINEGFNAVKAQADAVVFEFGRSRGRKLKIRDDIRRWQPMVGTLLQVQITGLQYVLEKRLQDLPAAVTEAQIAFEEDMVSAARAMADEVAGKAPRPAPDVQASAARLRDEIQKHYTPVPAVLVDMITLSQNLASIMAPLYEDIHATFSTPELAVVHRPGIRPAEA